MDPVTNMSKASQFPISLGLKCKNRNIPSEYKYNSFISCPTRQSGGESLGRREKLAQKVGRREKLAEKVGRREIYHPVPPPSF